MDAAKLYEIVDDRAVEGAPVLVYALTGFIDGGEAGEGLAEHLLATLPHRAVARFDVDLLHDYRAQRPRVVFAEDHFEQYTPPELTLYAVRDDAGAEFLLLTGPEPDTRWEAFTEAMLELVRRFGVRLTIGVHGIPMTVPHTRPLGYTTHATKPELITGTNPWQGELSLPAGASTLLEVRLGEADQDAMGFAVHVPHYLAENRYPEAVVTLLQAVSRVTGLLLPVGNLEEEATYVRSLVESQVASNDVVRKVVHELEEQYDENADTATPRELPELSALPSGDDIAAEAEQFLAGLDDDEGDATD
ncbi:MAG: PAC2 family protein [Streptosporangiales bacterium]|nr:PAC2 family protein [Streptosporangiales bacterium]MBO0890357.1 PAC2 family protein [Acidothermales bacterium]